MKHPFPRHEDWHDPRFLTLVAVGAIDLVVVAIVGVLT